MVSLTILIVFGLYEVFARGLAPMPVDQAALEEIAVETPGPDGSPSSPGITVLLLLRAFSSGAVALTGVEAISNGVPAFKKPESKNAATTLWRWAASSARSSSGISVLAQPTCSRP